MARHIPTRFQDKLRLVTTAIALARGEDRRHFDFTEEMAPGVRIILSEVEGTPLAFSLWTMPADVAELCGDGAYPAAAAALVIDKGQAQDALAHGVLVDLSQFVRSESNPGAYYVLLDYLSPEQVHRVLHRVVPALPAHQAA
jgi:hypothetical protein